MSGKARLADSLVAQDILSVDEAAALRLDRDAPPISSQVIAAGKDVRAVIHAVSAALHVPPVPTGSLNAIPDAILDGVDAMNCWQLLAVPFGTEDGLLQVAFVEPTVKIAWRARELGLPAFTAHVAPEDDVRRALTTSFGVDPGVAIPEEGFDDVDAEWDPPTAEVDPDLSIPPADSLLSAESLLSDEGAQSDGPLLTAEGPMADAWRSAEESIRIGSVVEEVVDSEDPTNVGAPNPFHDIPKTLTVEPDKPTSEAFGPKTPETATKNPVSSVDPAHRPPIAPTDDNGFDAEATRVAFIDPALIGAIPTVAGNADLSLATSEAVPSLDPSDLVAVLSAQPASAQPASAQLASAQPASAESINLTLVPSESKSNDDGIDIDMAFDVEEPKEPSLAESVEPAEFVSDYIDLDEDGDDDAGGPKTQTGLDTPSVSHIPDDSDTHFDDDDLASDGGSLGAVKDDGAARTGGTKVSTPQFRSQIASAETPSLSPMPTTKPEMKTGEVRRDSLERFEIGKRIGRGGMAEVFSATDRVSGRKVALKIMHEHLADDSESRARFQHEVDVGGELAHGNIVRVLAADTTCERPFFACELVDGGEVSKLLGKIDRLPALVAARIIAETLRGLSLAHEKGIVHRDIKPENLLLTNDGTVKIADFGVACRVGQKSIDGSAAGTTIYMSPEQIRGKALTASSDLFTVGVVFVELLTGTNPFQDTNPSASMLRITNGQRPLLFECDATVPAAVEYVVERLLESDLERRYQTADEALTDLVGFIGPLHSRYKNLLAECLRSPRATSEKLKKDQAQDELHRGDALVGGAKSKRAQAALAFFRATLLDPQLGAAQSRLAKLKEMDGIDFAARGDRRIVAMKQALHDDPSDVVLLGRLAEAYRSQGDMYRAAMYFKKYLNRNPSDNAMRSRLAWVVGTDTASPYGTGIEEPMS